MYLINKSDNALAELHRQSFSQLGFREREHLQEWIAKKSNIFGEELLIIQKEFDGFNDTRERLDLLALDKEGRLVVIENKLDDSGRDVVWQALKYASYCSTLRKEQIASIYQDYLNRFERGSQAVDKLAEFLEADYDELQLNEGNSQRIIFVAAHFRKEVTSTVLWLMSHQLQIQCFKVEPYALGDQLLLKIDQILPVKETEDLMIVLDKKKKEEKSTDTELKNRHHLRLEFWPELLETLNKTECQLFANISPAKDHWLNAGSGVSGCHFTLIFNQDLARIELAFTHSQKEVNKLRFDHFLHAKAKIEKDFGHPLSWKRLDDKISSRIEFEQPFDCYNRDNWPAIISWFCKTLPPFVQALKPHLSKKLPSLPSNGSPEEQA